MSYYHDLTTEKSWRELRLLVEKVRFVLIGGWATYLYTQGLKSKDIDIVVEFDQLARLRAEYELIKNDRLKKYEARKGEVQIDVYLPHYSEIGLPLDEVIRRAKQMGGYTVVQVDDLMGLKLLALRDRGRSAKGRKDFLDVVSLGQTEMINWREVIGRLKNQDKEEAVQVFIELLGENTKLDELDLNTHQYARLKKKILREMGR